MIVVDVVKIDTGKAFDGLGYARIPRCIVDGGLQVIHSGRVRILLGLLTEHRLQYRISKPKGTLEMTK